MHSQGSYQPIRERSGVSGASGRQQEFDQGRHDHETDNDQHSFILDESLLMSQPSAPVQEAQSSRSSPAVEDPSQSKKMDLEVSAGKSAQPTEPLTITQQVSLNNKVAQIRKKTFIETPSPKLKKPKKE